MIDKAFNLLTTIVVLATVTVILAKTSNTQGVLGTFFSGFAGSLKTAQGR